MGKSVVVLFAFVLGAAYARNCPRGDGLVLTHVLFRHGNRTANGIGELYPKDPYYNKTYFPIGLGQLTNAGKRKEFSVGTALRNRYNEFLGDAYYPGIIDARTTDYNRTKASFLFASAGLFPPKGQERWSNLDWQAVPYNYWPGDNDSILMGINCPNYLRQYAEQVQLWQSRGEYDPYKEDFEYISKNSGLNVTKFQDIYNLYFGISTEVEYGLKQPAWLSKVWPDKIIYYSVKEYHFSMSTTDLIRMAAGYHLQKIVLDTIAKTQEGDTQFKRKMYIYSAHENNIAQLLITLGVFDDKIPNYGSYLILEVHKIAGVYGFKILYENYYDSNGPKLLKIPGCNEFCPLDQFQKLFEEYYPEPNLCWDTK